MPYPYRAILDAGVCAGLSWGMGSALRNDKGLSVLRIPLDLALAHRCDDLHLCQVTDDGTGTRDRPVADLKVA